MLWVPDALILGSFGALCADFGQFLNGIMFEDVVKTLKTPVEWRIPPRKPRQRGHTSVGYTKGGVHQRGAHPQARPRSSQKTERAFLGVCVVGG